MEIPRQSPAMHIFLILLALPSLGANALGSNEFPYETTLKPDGSFKLFWNFDHDSIIFQYHAASKGWAGLGFSSNGGMAGADIAVFWIDQNGVGFVSDRHASQNGFPPEDKHQDYVLIKSIRNETHLIVTFSRKRNTCDSEDWPLTADTIRVIFAANDEIPENKNSFSKHTIRGSKNVHFFDRGMDTEPGQPAGDNVMEIKLAVTNVTVPDNDHTTYWCDVLKIPKPKNKVHIIKIDPLIQAENVDVLHHILAFLCPRDMSQYVGHGGSCFDKENEAIVICQNQMLAGWSVGGESTVYPEDVGMPFPYTTGDDMFIMLEMHYDNRELKKGKVDSSGLRLWVTEDLRPKEAGQISLGYQVGDYKQIIPPGVDEFTNYAYCPAHCTSGFPIGGLKIIGGLLHTHLAGRKVRLHHYRNGKQLPDIFGDEHYDFNYQGDELVTECVYETKNRNWTTLSGIATSDEMCLIYAVYYPAIYWGFVCVGAPDHKNIMKDLNITHESADPPEKTSFHWTDENKAKFQKANRDSVHKIQCLRQDIRKPPVDFTNYNGTGKLDGFDIYYQYGYPNVTKPLIPNDPCKGGAISPLGNNGPFVWILMTILAVMFNFAIKFEYAFL